MESLPIIQLPLQTTLPVLTEAMYFLGRRFGWKSQQSLFKLIDSDRLVILHLGTAELSRIEELMAKYADLPMDFADGSLVAIAEGRSLEKVFTLDKHFQVYRLRG